MTQDLWSAVDAYVNGLLLQPDPVLDAALAASVAAGLPGIHVAPNQGKLLHLLARACGARHVLEIGTLGGYSTIWLARALPVGGRLVTLEVNPKHAEVAAANIARAGLSEVIEIRLGDALERLAQLAGEETAPFDLVFIDADKPRLAEYFDRSLALCRPGSLIVVDNVVRKGAVIDAGDTDPNVQGVRRLMAKLAEEGRVEATTIQTVGSKGHDGFTLALVLRAGFAA